MKPTILLFAALLTLSACLSPKDQLHKLLVKYPEIAGTDTVATMHLVPVPPDTVREQVLLHDTVTIESTRQVVRIVRVPTGHPCDDVPVLANVEARVHPDTIHHLVRTPCDTVMPTRVVYEAPFWVWALVGLLAMSLLLSLWKR